MAYFNDDNLTEQMCIRSYTQVPVPKTKRVLPASDTTHQE
jgi:hypothetical protein